MNVETIIDGVLQNNRRALAKAITLAESRKPAHQQDAAFLLEALAKHTGSSMRIGITGVPGVGKSTFIEAFGKYLTAQGHRVAVLAVDPSSSITGGSILGDKTRMEELSRDENAFIRPSPSGVTLGGVARKTRETMLLCEAAGYDVIIIETVGVGQSETTVAQMVDVFLLLQISGAGDELQGIKKGVMEIADLIVINKAEGDNKPKAELAKSQLETALHILRPKSRNWSVPVLLASALHNTGVDGVWEKLNEYKEKMSASGEFEEKRRQQSVDWMWNMVLDDLKDIFMQNANVLSRLESVQKAVAEGVTTPGAAARRLLEAFRKPV